MKVKVMKCDSWPDYVGQVGWIIEEGLSYVWVKFADSRFGTSWFYPTELMSTK